MGLDMYAKKIRPDCAMELFKYHHDEELHHDATSLCYWRKHYSLHDWMAALYVEKGGTEVFNCIPMLLTVADLERLRLDINDGTMYADDEYGNNAQEDLGFVIKALECINDGYCVYYDSWY